MQFAAASKDKKYFSASISGFIAVTQKFKLH
jgi:hypothetical protein